MKVEFFPLPFRRDHAVFASDALQVEAEKFEARSDVSQPSRERHLVEFGVLVIFFVPFVVDLVASDSLSVLLLENRSMINSAMVFTVCDRNAAHVKRDLSTQVRSRLCQETMAPICTAVSSGDSNLSNAKYVAGSTTVTLRSCRSHACRLAWPASAPALEGHHCGGIRHNHECLQRSRSPTVDARSTVTVKARREAGHDSACFMTKSSRTAPIRQLFASRFKPPGRQSPDRETEALNEARCVRHLLILPDPGSGYLLGVSFAAKPFRRP